MDYIKNNMDNMNSLEAHLDNVINVYSSGLNTSDQIKLLDHVRYLILQIKHDTWTIRSNGHHVNCDLINDRTVIITPQTRSALKFLRQVDRYLKNI